MKLKKTVAQLVVLGLGMAGIFSLNAASQVAATAQTTFNLTVIPPSCSLTAPSSITLTDQKPGMMDEGNIRKVRNLSDFRHHNSNTG
ncbi:TPA: hypothetical protein J1342_004398 [Escherichia coli]|nr:hypothetical protein [Escherichia coli]